MSRRVRQFFEFNQFRLDVERARLMKDGEVVHLPPKAAALLLVLLKHPGRAVEKEELMEALWPDAVVEESNLTQTVHLLRKALSKCSDAGSFIETLPRFGYRLVADVREQWSEGEGLAVQPPQFDPTPISAQVSSESREKESLSLPSTESKGLRSSLRAVLLGWLQKRLSAP